MKNYSQSGLILLAALVGLCFVVEAAISDEPAPKAVASTVVPAAPAKPDPRVKAAPLCWAGIEAQAAPLAVDINWLLGGSPLVPLGLTGVTAEGAQLDGAVGMTQTFTILNGQIKKTAFCMFLADGTLLGVDIGD